MQVGHFISQFHVLFLSVALGSLATTPTTYLLLGKSLTLLFLAAEGAPYLTPPCDPSIPSHPKLSMTCYSKLKASDTLFDCCRDRLHDQPAQLCHRLQEEERGGIGQGRGGADGKRTMITNDFQRICRF